jgi:drug/metabolite transporter (DMT)-like permease
LRGYLVLAIGVVGLSTAGVLYKLATAPTLSIVAYRNLFAVVVTAAIWLVSKSAFARPRAPIARADAGAATLAGCLFALDITLWATSVQFTSISSAALLVSMDPIFVAIFAALFLGERPSPAMIAGMAVAAAGAATITVGDFQISGRALLGDLLALSAAFAETGYLLLGRHVRQRVDTQRYVLIVYAACAACVWIVLLAARMPATLDGHNVLVSFALALFATVLGHTLVSISLGHMPAAVVAFSFLSQPIITALLAYLVLAQRIAPLTAIGGSIALVGIGVVAFANERAVSSGPAQAI